MRTTTTKALTLILFAAFVSTQAFATYIVVLKDGTKYKAKAKWTVAGGKATITLENGQTLQLDPNLIDGPKSDQINKAGLGSVDIIDQGQAPSSATTTQSQSSLGQAFKLRKAPAGNTPPPPVTQITNTPAASGAPLSAEVIDKFERAFENVGIFEHKVVATGPHSLRAEVTADNEEKVFNAISATSFLTVRNAGVTGSQIDVVELFMKTTNGGSSGRFHMTREDATALDTQKISKQDYYVRNVIF